MLLPKKMNKNLVHHDLLSAKNWILANQNTEGAILWDQKGKWDNWDHCECLIALAIYEEWEAFNKGINFSLKKLDEKGLVRSEYINGLVSKDFSEAHHASYIFLPLLQKYLIDNDVDYLKKFRTEIHKIYGALKNFKNGDGFYYWAFDDNGYSDNSLITATCSIELSRRAYNKICEIIGDTSYADSSAAITQDMLKSKRFNRDGIDRSRFSMDAYYPLLCNCGDKKEATKVLQKFYVEGRGVKCVVEEPWVTMAESSECVIALYKIGMRAEAEKIFKEILQYKNTAGYFPTGYQYDLDVFWPEENSTWTNAAIIMAADCLYDISGCEKVILL